MSKTTIEVFIDGDCPLCSREVSWLRCLDRDASIRFTDISAPDFDARRYDVTRQQMMDRIHARFPSGQWITGVEVFREMYTRVGFSTAVAISRWPIVSQLLDVAYAVFAKSRLRLTGRCDLPSTRNASTSQLGPNQAG